MIEHYYLHHCLLIKLRHIRYRCAIQVTIRTTAAITHTAFAGKSAAVSNPAAKAIGTLQLLHLLMIITSLYTTPRLQKCYR